MHHAFMFLLDEHHECSFHVLLIITNQLWSLQGFLWKFAWVYTREHYKGHNLIFCVPRSTCAPRIHKFLSVLYAPFSDEEYNMPFTSVAKMLLNRVNIQLSLSPENMTHGNTIKLFSQIPESFPDCQVDFQVKMNSGDFVVNSDNSIISPQFLEDVII